MVIIVRFFSIFIVLNIILLSAAIADRIYMKLEVYNENKLIIYTKTNCLVYDFKININGYRVNCSGDKIILWGRDLNFNSNNPQENVMILFDLAKMSVITKGFDKRIFNAFYINGNKEIFISSGLGYQLGINTGDLKVVNKDFDFYDIGMFETCDRDKSWYFNRYPETD